MIPTLAKLDFGDNVKLVRALFATANQWSDLNFKVMSSGLQTQMVEVSHAAMIMGYGHKDIISELNAPDINIGVSPDNISSVLRKIKKVDSVQLGFKEINEKFAMTIDIKHGNLSKKYSFEAWESEFLRVPSFKGETVFKLPVKDFYGYLDEIAIFSDDVIIEVGEKDSVKFYPYTTEDERASAEIEVETEINRSQGVTAKSVYPISYLKWPKPLLSLYDTLEITLNTDYPIVMRFGDETVMQFIALVAPRVNVY